MGWSWILGDHVRIFPAAHLWLEATGDCYGGSGVAVSDCSTGPGDAVGVLLHVAGLFVFRLAGSMLWFIGAQPQVLFATDGGERTRAPRTHASLLLAAGVGWGS